MKERIGFLEREIVSLSKSREQALRQAFAKNPPPPEPEIQMDEPIPQREQVVSIVVDRLPAILISSPALSAVAVHASGLTCRTFSAPKSIAPGSNEPSRETFWSRSLRSTKY